MHLIARLRLNSTELKDHAAANNLASHFIKLYGASGVNPYHLGIQISQPLTDALLNRLRKNSRPRVSRRQIVFCADDIEFGWPQVSAKRIVWPT